MTDRLALIFGIVLILIFGSDFLFNGGQGTIFLARKFTALVNYVQFWR